MQNKLKLNKINDHLNNFNRKIQYHQLQLEFLYLQRDLHQSLINCSDQNALFISIGKLAQAIEDDDRFNIICEGNIFVHATAYIDSNGNRISYWNYDINSDTTTILLNDDQKIEIPLNQVPYSLYLSDTILTEFNQLCDAEEWTIKDNTITTIFSLPVMLVTSKIDDVTFNKDTISIMETIKPKLSELADPNHDNSDQSNNHIHLSSTDQSNDDKYLLSTDSDTDHNYLTLNNSDVDHNYLLSSNSESDNDNDNNSMISNISKYNTSPNINLNVDYTNNDQSKSDSDSNNNPNNDSDSESDNNLNNDSDSENDNDYDNKINIYPSFLNSKLSCIQTKTNNIKHFIDPTLKVKNTITIPLINAKTFTIFTHYQDLASNYINLLNTLLPWWSPLSVNVESHTDPTKKKNKVDLALLLIKHSNRAFGAQIVTFSTELLRYANKLIIIVLYNPTNEDKLADPDMLKSIYEDNPPIYQSPLLNNILILSCVTKLNDRQNKLLRNAILQPTSIFPLNINQLEQFIDECLLLEQS